MINHGIKIEIYHPVLTAFDMIKLLVLRFHPRNLEIPSQSNKDQKGANALKSLGINLIQFNSIKISKNCLQHHNPGPTDAVNLNKKSSLSVAELEKGSLLRNMTSNQPNALRFSLKSKKALFSSKT